MKIKDALALLPSVAGNEHFDAEQIEEQLRQGSKDAGARKTFLNNLSTQEPGGQG